MTLKEETLEEVRTVLASKVRKLTVDSYPEPLLTPLLDPDYDGLRAVFHWRRCRAELLPIMECDTCPIVSRYSYWQLADDGSFEGALTKALLQMWALHNAKIDTIMAALTSMLVNRRGDTRQAACEAVLKWLREEP